MIISVGSNLTSDSLVVNLLQHSTVCIRFVSAIGRIMLSIVAFWDLFPLKRIYKSYLSIC